MARIAFSNRRAHHLLVLAFQRLIDLETQVCTTKRSQPQRMEQGSGSNESRNKLPRNVLAIAPRRAQRSRLCCSTDAGDKAASAETSSSRRTTGDECEHDPMCSSDR